MLSVQNRVEGVKSGVYTDGFTATAVTGLATSFIPSPDSTVTVTSVTYQDEDDVATDVNYADGSTVLPAVVPQVFDRPVKSIVFSGQITVYSGGKRKG